MNIFNERIELLLKERHLKKVDIIKGTGLPESTVRGWQLDGKTPSLSAAQKVAQFFNVSLDWLAGGEVRYNNADIEITKEDSELLFLFNRFDERDKNTLLEMARTINKHYLPMVADNTPVDFK